MIIPGGARLPSNVGAMSHVEPSAAEITSTPPSMRGTPPPKPSGTSARPDGPSVPSASTGAPPSGRPGPGSSALGSAEGAAATSAPPPKPAALGEDPGGAEAPVVDVDDAALGVEVHSERPAPIMRAMRMISIGEARPPPPEERKVLRIPDALPEVIGGYIDEVDIEVAVTDDEGIDVSIDDEVVAVPSQLVQRSKPPPPPRVRASEPPPVPVPALEGEGEGEGRVEGAPSVEVEATEDLEATDDLEELSVEASAPVRAPPPPKRRTGGEQRGEGAAPPKEKKRVRLWWEDLFTDDFARAILPLTATQLEREVTFIEDSLGLAQGGVVLDLACGIGQQSVALASRGYEVVGFDLSLPQLALAEELGLARGQKVNFVQGDMREMDFDEKFDGVLCWNTSFGYFEEEKNVLVAQNAFRALRPGGTLLLDVVNRDYVVAHQPSSVWFEGDACVCMDDMSVDFITSRLKVKRTLMLDDGRSRECTYSIRVYALHELGRMLHEIGFRVTEASGHPAYPGVFFGAQSPRVIIVAQKP
jgi:SAM-dependent methyltransferase